MPTEPPDGEKIAVLTPITLSSTSKVGPSELPLLMGASKRNAAISRHFERDPIPYELERDWPVEAAGVEPLHQELCSIRPTAIVRRKSGSRWCAGAPSGGGHDLVLRKARQQ